MRTRFAEGPVSMLNHQNIMSMPTDVLPFKQRLESLQIIAYQILSLTGCKIWTGSLVVLTWTYNTYILIIVVPAQLEFLPWPFNLCLHSEYKPFTSILSHQYATVLFKPFFLSLRNSTFHFFAECTLAIQSINISSVHLQISFVFYSLFRWSLWFQM